MAFGWGGELFQGFIRDFPEDWRQLEITYLFPLLILIPSVIMIVFGLRLLWTGLVILGNRTWTEVRITRRKLIVVEHLGGWRQKRKMLIPQTGELVLVRGLRYKNEKPNPATQSMRWLPREIWSLHLSTQNEEGFPLAIFYPQALTALYVETKDGETTAWLKMLSREEQEWILAYLQQSLSGSRS